VQIDLDYMVLNLSRRCIETF